MLVEMIFLFRASILTRGLVGMIGGNGDGVENPWRCLEPLQRKCMVLNNAANSLAAQGEFRCPDQQWHWSRVNLVGRSVGLLYGCCLPVPASVWGRSLPSSCQPAPWPRHPLVSPKSIPKEDAFAAEISISKHHLRSRDRGTVNL